MIELLSGQRQSGESDTAVVCCNDWLRLGSGRGIPELLRQYQDKSSFVRGFKPPTQSYKTLETWSSRYGWPGRATAYDAAWEARKNAERESILGYGLALTYERVRKLVRLAEFLEGQIYEQGESGLFHNVWLPDTKSIGFGKTAKEIEIERFNSPIFEQYRKVMEDIAKETGGRVQKQETTVNINIALLQQFEALASELNVSSGDLLEVYIQQLHALKSADTTSSG